MMEVAERDIDLQVIHIFGVNYTVADLLSRWFITEYPDKKLKNYVQNPIWLNLHIDIAYIN